MRRWRLAGRRRRRPGLLSSPDLGLCHAARLGGTGLLLAGVAFAVPPAMAQQTTFTMSSTTITFATPTVADYTAGYLCAGAIGFSGAADRRPHTDSLFVRATTPLTTLPSTIPGATKQLSDFQFNIDPAGCGATSTWTSIPPQSSAPALVYVTGKYRNQTITGTVYVRLLVTWASDLGGATYTLPSLRWFLNRPTTIPPPP